MSNMENPKKLAVDTTDSGFFSGEQQLSESFISSKEEVDDKVDTDMTKKTEFPTDNDNYTDSGIVSYSIQSEEVEVTPYVPEYLANKHHGVSRKPQHPTLNIEKYFEQDDEGYTKLHIAILHNIEQAINILISYAEQAQLNIRNFAGQTALHLAVILGMSATVRKLIDAGADINVRDSRCNTPLHLAVLNDDLNCVKMITAAIHPSPYGNEKILLANLEQWNFEGESCFFLACKQKNIPVMKHLANVGANVNTREARSGYTPLLYAIETRTVGKDVIKFLCEDCQSIVDLDAENYGGLTAFQLCLLTNQESMADYLVKKGASPFYTPESDYDDDYDTEDEDENISSEFEKNQLVNKIAEIAVN